MADGVDPNKIIFTGENPFIRLSQEEGGDFTTRTSFWRAIISPGGPGHVLFITSELTGNQPRAYSDNIQMTRWLQRNLETYMHSPFGDENLEVIDAIFEKSGDIRSFWTESVESLDDYIALTWYDLGEPFVAHSSPGNRPTMPHGVYTVLVPAAGARLTVNGEAASGSPFAQDREGTPSSTSCLAFSETWLSLR
jgi:hypothetical protein